MFTYIYLPRKRALPRNITPKVIAIITENGVKIEAYRGPFKCITHVEINVKKDEPNSP